MTDAELIKALREAKKHFWTQPQIELYPMMEAAADALEAAEKMIAELSLDNKMLKNTIDADKGVMLDRIRFLEKQKEGEWIGIEYDGYADGFPVYDVWECSECGEEHNGEEDTLPNYCPNCGARMRGERDDK